MKNLQRLFRKIAGFSCLFFLLPGLLTGCGSLQNTSAVKHGIKRLLPDAVVLDVESGKRPNGLYRFKRYTIDNKGVVFTYENYQARDTMFGLKTAFSNNNYCEALFEFFHEDIDRIIEKYQVEIEISGSYVQVTNGISHIQEIDNGINAIQEIYALIKDYIPETELTWFEFTICLNTANFGKPQIIFIEKQGDWDALYYQRLLYMNLKDAVEQGLAAKVETPPEVLDTIPQKYIRSLYINGEPYQSDKYEICFLYNIQDGKYYTPVGFGIELDYNGGVEDYLQREIIEKYYPGANYTISMKDKTTSYKIGDDQYLVKRQEDSLVFLKNGSELPIAHEREISDTHSGAVYYYWVSTDDFALLLGMSIDKVDESGVYLLLT